MTHTNALLRERTRADIDKQVDKVLRNLGGVEPPLNLEQVRALLRLHLSYYSASETSFLGEMVHKLVVAGKQVLRRPGLLWDAVKKCDLKALYLFDQRSILISRELPKLKQRWGQAHEVGHSIIPWHEQLCHGDHDQTLSLECQEQIEAEANYAAGRLLFIGDRFRDELLSSVIDIKNVRRLAKRYDNTITSALWRCVESVPIPAFALVGMHPNGLVLGGAEPVRRFIRSRRFSTEFPGITPEAIFDLLRTFCRNGRGQIGASDLLLRDANGEQHQFAVECFFNTYDALTLGMWSRPSPTVVAL